MHWSGFPVEALGRRVIGQGAARCLFLAVVLGSVPGLSRAQIIGSAERSRGRYMLDVLRDLLEEHYYDPTLRGIDLRAAAARADSQIRSAQSNGQIFTIISSLFQLLEDSHTWFVPPLRAAGVEYGWALQMIGDSCYVVGVEPGSDAAAKGLSVGDRVIALDEYAPARRTLHQVQNYLQMISPRPTVRFELEAPDGARRTLEVSAKVTNRPPVVDLVTAVRRRELGDPRHNEVVRWGDEIAVLRLTWLGAPSDVDEAMSQVRNAGTLILDLRGNGGGFESSLQRLVGHVFDRRLVIDTVRGRREPRAIESTAVRRPFGGRLYVLIDSESASAAEIFAYLIQVQRRGMVVGDRSAGAVVRSRLHSLSTGTTTMTYFYASITDADVIMPDGTRLEGRGVQPDALRRPSAADLAAGRDPVLALALTMAGHPVSSSEAGTLLRARERMGWRTPP